MDWLWNTLKAAPAEAWVALIGVVFGSLLTTFGVWLTNRFNRKQLKLQLEHGERLQSKQITKQRLEELHILVGQWSILHLENYTHVSSLMIGRFTLDEFYATDIEPIPNFDFSRLEMIVGMHGDGLISSLQAVKDILSAMTSIQVEFVDSYEAGNPSYAHNEAYALYQSQLTDAVKSFKAAIVKAAKEV